MERYNESLFGCGTRRVFLQDGRRFEAVIVGVDSKGRLIIAEGDAFRKLDHGQVQWS